MKNSDVTRGPIQLPGNADLTGREGFLLKVTSNSGAANFALIAAITDDANYICESGNVSGAYSQAAPLTPEQNVRAKLKGTCVPGDRLVLADPSNAGDEGKLRKLPATSGTYTVLAVAEETGVDGQLVLARPSRIGTVIVS